jgi:mannose-6-phosphate isomerase-like protein (cupin superfamily)
MSKAVKINETYRRPGAHERVLSVNFPAVEEVSPDTRMSINLIDESTGTKRTSVHYIRTPAGSGSPEGFHAHTWEQMFYVLAGTLTVEFEGEPGPIELQPGDVVVFPRGTRHKNYNTGEVETLHISINTGRHEHDDA